ncbi:MAG: hypothetical protein GC162_00110 [Planctomycetes bacterium]|nr:hypothetical protein [Planctomycetota bacterium]
MAANKRIRRLQKVISHGRRRRQGGSIHVFFIQWREGTSVDLPRPSRKCDSATLSWGNSGVIRYLARDFCTPLPGLNMSEPIRHQDIGIIVVDHGSRRPESNDMLLSVVKLFAEQTDYRIIEPAHMELAEPTIEQAFDRCVERGAKVVVCHPYFLLPGRHWNQDIPNLTAAAAKRHPGIRWMVTAPLGLNEKLPMVMSDAIAHCLSRVAGEAEECPACRGTGKCRINTVAETSGDVVIS